MNAAQKIVHLFGGQTTLAKLLSTKQSTISHWVKTGRIPPKWHSTILALGQDQGINLSVSVFVSDVGGESDAPPVSGTPRATHFGDLTIGEAVLPCYVLENGERVFSLKGVVVGLIETDGGQLAEYLKVKSLKPFLSEDLAPAENGTIPALIKFDTGGEGFTKFALGLPVEKFMDLCAAYSSAAESTEVTLTERQQRIAVKANSFLRACAKVGIIALVDEATGYQYDRAQDALQFKLKLYLEEEMRQWEKTFPDELWEEFGRLTKWKGAAHQRPKYWGKLVMELIYQYLDHDVADWLKNNAPKPKAGKNYHQWLSSQYGLKKLVEHIWMVIGMARACTTMAELRERMAQQFGRQRVQLNLFLPPPRNPPVLITSESEPENEQ